MLALLAVGAFVILLCYYYIRYYKYWENKGVPGPRPLPLVGNIGAGIIGLKHTFEVFTDIYRKYENYPYIGLFRGNHPCLMIADPEIIKNVLIKDFHHFMNNDLTADPKLEPLLSKNTFALKGEDWKKSRQLVAPCFATGKIKSVFPLAVSVSKDLVKYLSDNEGAVLNAKQVFNKYNCGIIAVCGYGIDENCFEDPNSIILDLAEKFVTPDSLQGFKLALSFFWPELIKVKITTESFDQGVIQLTKQTLKYRQENNVLRNDFFGYLSQIPSISVIELAAHMANIIVDGFETSSTVMTFILYELAANPECQIKLRSEINNVLRKHNGEITYEAIQDMNYLEACINESLRLHSVGAILSKTCTERYTFTPISSEFKEVNSVTLEKGSSVIIPALGIHLNPKYFHSPEKYIPERFLEKEEVQKRTYLPFGNGPRMCLGSRFGLMQLKIGIAQTIKNFEIVLNKKTKLPIKYDPFYFILYPKGGIWFTCKKIQD